MNKNPSLWELAVPLQVELRDACLGQQHPQTMNMELNDHQQTDHKSSQTPKQKLGSDFPGIATKPRST